MTKLKTCLALAALAAATPAIAGEITGSGDPTPIRNGVASSVCAYSGLNDDGLGPSSQVQAYGMFARAFGGGNIPVSNPGISCRGN